MRNVHRNGPPAPPPGVYLDGQQPTPAPALSDPPEDTSLADDLMEQTETSDSPESDTTTPPANVPEENENTSAPATRQRWFGLGKPKPERIAPEGAIIPDRGLRLVLYYILCMLNRPDKVPGISKRQELREWIREIIEIIASGVRPVISVGNLKSGSKTRTALGIASVLAYCCIGLKILVLPATKNTATGSLDKMAGVSGNGIGMRELSRSLGLFRSFAAVSQRLLLTRHGVSIIVKDENDSVESSDDYTVHRFKDTVRTLRPNTDILILDHGNDNFEMDGFGLEALRMSDALVLSARKNDAASVDSLLETIKAYHTDQKAGITPREIREANLLPLNRVPVNGYQAFLTGELISSRERMRGATVVMSCAKKYDKRKFQQMMMAKGQSADAKNLPEIWQGTGVVVNKDRHLAKEGKSTITDLDAISKLTFRQYVWLTLCVLREAKRVKQLEDRIWKSYEASLREYLEEAAKSLSKEDAPATEAASSERTHSAVAHTQPTQSLDYEGAGVL